MASWLLALGCLAVVGGCGPGAPPAPPTERMVAKLDDRTFIKPANPLEQALVDAARRPGSLEAGQRLETALLTTKVYIPTTMGSALEGVIKPGPRDVQAWHVFLPDGRRALALYSSLDRLPVLKGVAQGYIALSGRDALKMAADSPVALNWGVDPHVYWSPQQVVGILAGVPPPRARAGSPQG
ncbi:hypothetical protein QO010_003297 [Caulobacter ginsengisoli]|uniref:SseB protein N-terminal domain-containing protein n=1 Tax=Caulobacter ginsengisoli TaxID=400775 RepID=A0ABU0IWH6_9CAUL|nr:SseB family protein [Caulobacter ginsengisoli]MDQ0465508.1 hypothetical protein [Caulobacter ginsengisoli]